MADQCFRTASSRPGRENAFFASKRIAFWPSQFRCGVENEHLTLPALAQKGAASKGHPSSVPASARAIQLPSIKQFTPGASTARTHVAAGAREAATRKTGLPPLGKASAAACATVEELHTPVLAHAANKSDGQNTSAHRDAKARAFRRSTQYLADYDGGIGGESDLDESSPQSPQRLISAFENAGRSCRAECSYRSITTVDEEASARVLKVMFQLGLSRNSDIIKKLCELETSVLHGRVLQEVGHKKQMSRDEFYSMLKKVLRDDYLSRRDANTLFSVFDDDRSGLVDAIEFVSGFHSLMLSGVDDVAFKFLALLMEGREKSTANAFISRFELSILIEAAQNHFRGDREIFSLLAELPSRFDFAHHMGRIPVAQFRATIQEDDDLRVVFENLPNPSRKMREQPIITAKDALREHPDQYHWNSSVQLVADQFMHQCPELQRSAPEADTPKWWSSGGVVYRSSVSNPFPEPVFLRGALSHSDTLKSPAHS